LAKETLDEQKARMNKVLEIYRARLEILRTKKLIKDLETELDETPVEVSET